RWSRSFSRRTRTTDMTRRLVTLTAAAALLAFSALPSLADHHGGGNGGGGGWHGGGGNAKSGGGVGGGGGGWGGGVGGVGRRRGLACRGRLAREQWQLERRWLARRRRLIGTAVTGMAGVVAGTMAVMVVAGELVPRLVLALALESSGERWQRLPIMVAMTTAT